MGDYAARDDARKGIVDPDVGNLSGFHAAGRLKFAETDREPDCDAMHAWIQPVEPEPAQLVRVGVIIVSAHFAGVKGSANEKRPAMGEVHPQDSAVIAHHKGRKRHVHALFLAAGPCLELPAIRDVISFGPCMNPGPARLDLEPVGAVLQGAPAGGILEFPVAWVTFFFFLRIRMRPDLDPWHRIPVFIQDPARDGANWNEIDSKRSRLRFPDCKNDVLDDLGSFGHDARLPSAGRQGYGRNGAGCISSQNEIEPLGLIPPQQPQRERFPRPWLSC